MHLLIHAGLTVNRLSAHPASVLLLGMFGLHLTHFRCVRGRDRTAFSLIKDKLFTLRELHLS